jgi:hypothetical protein
MASQLASIGEASKTTGSTRDSLSRTSPHARTSVSTALEQDFTVEGKKGNLQCPFSKPQITPDVEAEEQPDMNEDGDPTPQHSSDPICAAMLEEMRLKPRADSSDQVPKCPIRYMDQHSAAEIAQFVETHKHSLPRSHEVCLRRYQHDEEQIRKIDSKYGNMISMIEGLSQLHQPMLREDASGEEERLRRESQLEIVSNSRVKDWANDVTATGETGSESDQDVAVSTEDRQSHFDRPLKEVRVGESPSRPWGISVPIYEPLSHEDGGHPMSPPPAPVRMSPPPDHVQLLAETAPDTAVETPVKKPGKCPFDHTKLAAMGLGGMRPSEMHISEPPATPNAQKDSPFVSPRQDPVSVAPPQLAQPAFINPGMAKDVAAGGPQMVFTGPVFIGYPMDQAIQFMNQYRPAGS